MLTILNSLTFMPPSKQPHHHQYDCNNEDGTKVEEENNQKCPEVVGVFDDQKQKSVSFRKLIINEIHIY